MRSQSRQGGLRAELALGRRELALYLAAGLVYVAIGVAVPEFLFSGLVAVVFLLLFVLALPAVVRRLRG
jgi:hypothetical protein